MQPFPNWLVLLINVHLRSVLFFSWLHSSFLFITESYFIDKMGHSALIHSPKKVHVGCFQFLLIVNTADVNICVLVFLCLVCL